MQTILINTTNDSLYEEIHKFFYKYNRFEVTIDRVCLIGSKVRLTADKEAMLSKVRNCSFAVTILIKEIDHITIVTKREMEKAVGLHRNIAIYYPYCEYNSIILQIDNKYENMISCSHHN